MSGTALAQPAQNAPAGKKSNPSLESELGENFADAVLAPSTTKSPTARKKTSGSSSMDDKEGAKKAVAKPPPKKEDEEISLLTGAEDFADEGAVQTTTKQSKRGFSLFGGGKSKKKKAKRKGKGKRAANSMAPDSLAQQSEYDTNVDHMASMRADVGEEEGLLSIGVDRFNDRQDSVVIHRKARKSLTNSLKLDMDIFNYLQEREPSFDETAMDAADANRLNVGGSAKGQPVQKTKKQLKKEAKMRKKKEKMRKKRVQSQQLEIPDLPPPNMEGGARVVTMVADKELERREQLLNRKKRRGFFGAIRRGFSFFIPSRRGAKKLMNRMSFGSFNETNTEDMRGLLAEQEQLEKEKRKRKSDEVTDLSDDSDIDMTLLERNTKRGNPAKKTEDELTGRARESSRLSKIFKNEELDDEEAHVMPKDKVAMRNSVAAIPDVGAGAPEPVEGVDEDLLKPSTKKITDWDDSADEEKVQTKGKKKSAVKEEVEDVSNGSGSFEKEREGSGKKDEFLGSAMTQSSTKLARVKLSGDSDDKIREEKNATSVSKAFTLNQDGMLNVSGKIKVVNTGRTSTDRLSVPPPPIPDEGRASDAPDEGRESLSNLPPPLIDEMNPLYASIASDISIPPAPKNPEATAEQPVLNVPPPPVTQDGRESLPPPPLPPLPPMSKENTAFKPEKPQLIPTEELVKDHEEEFTSGLLMVTDDQ